MIFSEHGQNPALDLQSLRLSEDWLHGRIGGLQSDAPVRLAVKPLQCGLRAVEKSNYDFIYGKGSWDRREARWAMYSAVEVVETVETVETTKQKAAREAKEEASYARFQAKQERQRKAYWGRRDINAWSAGSAASCRANPSTARFLGGKSFNQNWP